MAKVLNVANFVLLCIGFLWAIFAGVFGMAYLGFVLAVVIGLVVGVLHIVCDRDGKQLINLLMASIAFLALTATFFPIAAMYLGDSVMQVFISLAGLFLPVVVLSGTRLMLRIALSK